MPAPSKRMRITKLAVDGMEDGAILWDADVPGFAARRLATGIAYVLKYRSCGKQRWYTIGRHGAPWTAQTARDEARRLLGEIADGGDPQGSKALARVAQIEPTEDKTVRAALDAFANRYLVKLRSATDVRRILEREVLSAWGARPLESVTKRDVIELLDRIVDRGAPIQANRVLAHTRKFFNWCVSRDMLTQSPCVGVKAPSDEEDRDRVLSADELRFLWNAADAMPYPFGPFGKLLLLTAQRLREVAGMRWDEVDFDAAMWEIPKERAKNGQVHRVPLAPAAIDILRAIPRASAFVFSTTGKTPISGFSRAKDTLNAKALELMRKAAENRGEDASAVQPPPDWVFHDFRRTAITNMGQMGVPPHVADKVLNHVQGTIKGVAAIYNRHQYLDERRDALHAWARRIDQIVNGTPSNVVTLAERRAGMRE
jgi:integrase